MQGYSRLILFAEPAHDVFGNIAIPVPLKRSHARALLAPRKSYCEPVFRSSLALVVA